MKLHFGKLGALVIFTAMAPAFSQQVAPQKIDKVEVTGSNIKRVDAETASVIQVITKEDIQKSGVNTVAELLRAVPAISGGALADYNAGNGFARSTTSASLRGLGSIGTLVLLNGRRIAPAAVADPNTGQGQAYNLNTIPLAAIERVEIQKDGGSAIYGSDAIAGVINFILRKDYQGGEITVTSGATTRNEFRNASVSGTVGFGDLARDRFNVLVSGEYFRREAASFNDPNGIDNDGYARLTNRNVLSAGASSSTPIPNFFREATLGNGVFNVPLATDPRCPANQRFAANAGCRYNGFNDIQLQSRAQRAGFLTRGTIDFTSTLQGVAEFSFTRAINNFVEAPQLLDGTSSGTIWFNRDGERRRFLLSLPAGHPDNPTNGTTNVAVGLRYRFSDLGPTYNETTNDAYRGLVGLSGMIANWDWQTALLYSRTERKEVANGRLFFPALVDAVNNQSYRFGGTNSADLIAKLNPYRTSKGNTDLSALDLKANRELFELRGGALAVAIGAEIRRESFSINSDPRQVAGDFVAISSTTVNSSRNVSALFGELIAPILKNVEVQAAVRFDKYSDYGNSTTPKFGVKWKPVDMLAVRANYSEAFRAPSLTQVSTSRVQSFSTVTDPIRCPNGTTPLPGGDAEDCGRKAIASLFLPTTDLKPERSKSFGAGFIFSPLSNLSFQTDYWEIRRRDQIDRFGPQQVVNNEFTPNFIGGTVQRNQNPASFLPGVPNSGPIETAVRRFLNLGETRVKGIDYEANAKFKLGTGTLGLNGQATWIIRYDYQFEKGGRTDNGAGNFLLFETPKLRASWGASYTESDYSMFFRYNYTGGWDYGDPSNRNSANLSDPSCYLSATSPSLAYLGRCQVKAWTTVDIGGSYNGLRNWVFSAVLRNIEDKRAPYDPNQTTLGFNPSFHNPLGQNLNLSATYRFK